MRPLQLRAAPAVVVLVLATVAASCSPGGGEDEGRVNVVASFARLVELAQRVGGERVQVTDLTPAGAEPHDLEPSPGDLDAIEDAEVVLFLGAGFQPGVEKAVRRADRAVNLLAPGEEDDPHIWLDPVRFAQAVGPVEEALGDADPQGRPGYRRRADEVRAELERLHREYEAGLARCRLRVFVTAHDAFGRLADRYGLDQEPITGISPEAEPDARRLAQLADLVRQRGVTTIFTEELVSPRVAEALAREAGVRTAVLDPLEGRARGGYAAAMRRNLERLRAALDCT